MISHPIVKKNTEYATYLFAKPLYLHYISDLHRSLKDQIPAIGSPPERGRGAMQGARMPGPKGSCATFKKGAAVP